MEYDNMAWKAYNKHSKNSPPNPLLSEAISLAKNREIALDIGCGAGRDTNVLAEHFDEVVALDSNDDCKLHFNSAGDNIEFYCCRIEDHSLPEAEYNLINAWNFLSFIPPASFRGVIKEIIRSLAQGGIFVGNIFGPEDGWSVNPNMTFLPENSIDRLFKNVNIIKIKQVKERKKPIIGNSKQWHYYNFIVKKGTDE